MLFNAIQLVTLDNGIRIAVDQVPHVDSVNIRVHNGIGARSESAAQNGIKHYGEHTGYMGTKNRTADQIDCNIEDAGGDANAYTSYEDTVHYVDVLSNEAASGLEVLSDVLLNATFPEKEVQMEKGPILEEIASFKDDPVIHVCALAQGLSFPGQSIGRPVIGTEESVKAITTQQVAQSWYEDYHNGNLILVASGYSDVEKLMGQATSLFGDLPRKEKSPVPSAFFIGGDKREMRKIEQLHMVMEFETVPYGDPDFYHVQALSVIMGGGCSSRLFREVRKRRGMVYEISTGTDHYSDTGTFAMQCATSSKNVPKLIPLVCDMFAQSAGSFTDAEIARAKKQLYARRVRPMVELGNRGEKIATDLLLFDRVIPLEEEIEKINAIDSDTLDKVAKKIFSGKLAFAAVGPIKKIEPYEKILDRLKL